MAEEENYVYKQPKSKMGILEKISKVIMSPSEFFDKIKEEKGLGEAFKYQLVILLVYSIASILLSLLVSFFVPGALSLIIIGILTGALIAYVLILILTFVGVAIIHVFVLLLGGKGTYSDTYKALVYSSTPSVLLGWIPLVNIIFGLYSLYLSIKGISKLHNISMLRAFFAVIGIILIILVVVMLMAAVAYIWFASIFADMLGSSGGMIPMGEFPFGSSDLSGGSASELIGSVTSALNTEFFIDRAAYSVETGELTLTIINAGTETIDASEMSISIDENNLGNPCSGEAEENKRIDCSFIVTDVEVECDYGSLITVTLPNGIMHATFISC